MANGKLNRLDFPMGQGSSRCSGPLPRVAGPLGSAGQQTPCVTSSPVLRVAVQVLEQGRVKGIKIEPRSQQTPTVTPRTLGLNFPGGGQGVQPRVGEQGG